MISVENLTKYYGVKKAVDNISFNVKKGEILGFLGPNAAGKTTTMRVITCYLSASAGTVKVGDYNIFENPIEVKRMIGYMPENPPLYTDMTVQSYLEFVGMIKGLSRKGLNDGVKRVMHVTAIEHVKERITGKLSKGYRQRVGLAQALIHNPEILILDEPTAGLDPKQIIETRELIKSLAGKHTIVVSTHILPEVSMTCERVLIINEGKIVAEDTIDNLQHRIRGSETILIEVEGPKSEILETLKKIEGISDVKFQKTKGENIHIFHIEAKSSDRARATLARAIISKNWNLYEMKTIGMSLEDIFLKLTTKDEEV
jgi:ABC-2 type transport system ATP-binding protein